MSVCHTVWVPIVESLTIETSTASVSASNASNSCCPYGHAMCTSQCRTQQMLQSEILDAGTLCVASDGGWNLGKGQKVRGAAVVVISSTGNSRGSTGARRRPRRRSGPSRPRPRSPPKLASRCRPGRGRRGARAGRDGNRRRPPRDDWRGRGRVAPAHGVHDGPLSRASNWNISALHNFG